MSEAGQQQSGDVIESESRPRKTIREAQQELAHNCGFGNDIIWDILNANDGEIMKGKIKQLIPDQIRGQKEIQNLRECIFENVWNQRKYTNGTSVSYIFYVMVTEDQDFNTAPESTAFSCHPVFRCKKCEKNKLLVEKPYINVGKSIFV